MYKYFKGFGLNETIYANALAYELTLRGHQVEREVRIVGATRGAASGNNDWTLWWIET